MSSLAEQSLQEVFAAYDLGGEVAGALRYGKGHINDTFCAYVQTPEGECRRFILQRMSAAAFKHPDQLMANIVGVTEHLRKKIAAAGGDPARETLTVHPHGRKLFHRFFGRRLACVSFCGEHPVPAVC